MVALSREQRDAFWRDGYLVAEEAVTSAELSALKAEIVSWVEQSRAHSAPFGPPTVDGRPRYDMGVEHTPEKPALRRINNPSDISEAYREVMLDARMVDMVAELVGPNLKFHHCKINLKLPGAKTEVAYHQDFAYTPHTNDDIVTALLFLDDVDEGNGALTVVPGSHKGPVLSLFDGAAMYRAWQEALNTADAAAQLEAFLDFAAWAAICDASESTTMRTPVFQAALDSADPVLRLAALRNLYVFTPDRAAVLLAGREDPENPGMAMWRQHYASLHAGRR